MPDNITIVNHVPEALVALERRLATEYRKAFDKIGGKAVKTVKRNFDSYAANASGQTRESIQALIGEARGSFSMTVQATGDRAKVIQWIENGRGPGRMPPVAVIEEWMDDTGLSTGDYSTDRSVAFLIARQIGRYGTKGHKIFARSQGEVVTNAKKEIEAATRRALKGK